MKTPLAVVLLVVGMVACGGSGGRSTALPLDASRRPAGQGWYCTTQTNGPGGMCFREPQACADVLAVDSDDGMLLSPCAAQPVAYCHTYFYMLTKEPGYLCRPTKPMCDRFAAEWAVPPTDYRDVSSCGAWD